MSELFGRRVDRVLFAATKADLLHHADHDRLENILRTLVDEAANRANMTGAANDVAAIAAIRATREATVKQKSGDLACIAGIPQPGEKIGDLTFDGTKEAAIFPGDPAMQLPPTISERHARPDAGRDDEDHRSRQCLAGEQDHARLRPPPQASQGPLN